MAGPSDDFFRDVVATVGGDLAAQLPIIEKRRTAAKALGQDLSLADVAVKMQLIDEAKRAELAQLEGGDAPAPEPAPPAASATPSGTRRTAAAKLPSAGKVSAAAAKPPAPAAPKTGPATPRPVARATPPAPAPAAAADPGALTECMQCNNTLAAGSDPKGTGLCATCRGEAESLGEDDSEARRTGSRPTKRRPRGGAAATPGGRPAARPAASTATGPLLIMGAVLMAALIVAVAFIIKQQQQPPPEVAVSPSPAVVRPSPSPVAIDPSPVPTPAPAATPSTSHKAKLANMALVAIKLARTGDKTGAKKQLARIRLEATEPEDAEIVKAAEKEVESALREATHGAASPEPADVDANGHRIPPVVNVADDPSPPPGPGSNPAEASSRATYRDWRAKLDPLLARFDLDGARALLAQAPPLEGSAAQDLADDKQIPDALERFLAMAGRGAKKAVGSTMDLHLAAGTKIRGKITEVDGVAITVAGQGGDQLVKVGELASEDLVAFATSGLTKDAQQDYALGRGLTAYYACDLDAARTSLGGTTLPLGKRIIDRIALEGAPKVGPRRPGQKPPSPGKSPKPEDSPPPDDAGGGIPPADLAALQALVTGKVYDEGDGRIGIRYSCSGDGEAGDFDSRGCDTWAVKQTEKPGTMNKTFTDLECGISSYEDIAILHKIPLKGDIEFTIDFWVNFMHDSNSGLSFIIGYDKKRWLGAAFGQQLWKCDGKSRPKAASPNPPELSKFSGARDCSVKVTRKGDTMKVSFNGADCGTTTGASGFDGKWGFLAHNLKIGIKRIEIHGVPDLKK